MKTSKLLGTLWPIEVEKEDEEKKRGRSQELLQRRDERLLDRLYYYRWIKLWRDEVYYAQLEREFDLSVSTMTQLVGLDDNIRYIKQLMNDRPDERFFRKKWEWMVW